jgi:hypothetical protein
MGQKRHRADQIIAKLPEAEIELAKGQTTPAVVRRLRISEQTYYRWREEYGGLRVDKARRPVVGLVALGCTLGLGLLLGWTAPAAADVMPPSILASNNLLIHSNEQHDVGELTKRYPLRSVLDRDPHTAWCYEPVPRVAPRTPEIVFELPAGLVADEIRLVNGYAKSEALYRANQRVRTLRIVFSNGEEQRASLAERAEIQRVALERPASSLLRIVLAEVWPGEKYKDLCLSEVDLLAEGRSLIPRPPWIEIPGGHYPAQPLVDASGKTVFSPGLEGSSRILFSNAGTHVAFGTSEMGQISLDTSSRLFGIAIVETRSGRARGYLAGTIARPIRWHPGDRSLDCEVYDIPAERWVPETVPLAGPPRPAD